jgi:phage gpG-like protein
MSDFNFRITLTGQDKLIARFNQANVKLATLLRTRLQTWANEMRNLAAAAAGRRSGRLAESITATVSGGEKSVVVRLQTSGVEYAAIQEFGGSIPGHQILPVKGTALQFAFGARGSIGGDYFASVFWPGATIHGKHFILGTLQQHRAEFLAICKQAEVDSLSE